MSKSDIFNHLSEFLGPDYLDRIMIDNHARRKGGIAAVDEDSILTCLELAGTNACHHVIQQTSPLYKTESEHDKKPREGKM
ncbi:MAG: hypothetical protein R2827_00455 [Bdellovibrionales bacterium]